MAKVMGREKPGDMPRRFFPKAFFDPSSYLKKVLVLIVCPGDDVGADFDMATGFMEAPDAFKDFLGHIRNAGSSTIAIIEIIFKAFNVGRDSIHEWGDSLDGVFRKSAVRNKKVEQARILGFLRDLFHGFHEDCRLIICVADSLTLIFQGELYYLMGFEIPVAEVCARCCPGQSGILTPLATQVASPRADRKDLHVPGEMNERLIEQVINLDRA